MKKSKLAIIGSGSLGSIVGENIKEHLANEYDLLGIFSSKIENSTKLANGLKCKAYASLDEIIKDKPDYIIEAASLNVVKDIGIEILKNGISLIPLSVGAFADNDFYKEAARAALENNSRVHLPSGAVGGLDVLSGAMLMEDVEVSISTEKSPKSLNGAPFLQGRQLSEESVEEVFSGSAEEAIKLFPKNVNVAVAVALASNGVKSTKVNIKSVPDLKSNKHSIKLVGNTINVDVIIESTPSANNPKSSSLAAYSVISLLKNLASPITF